MPEAQAQGDNPFDSKTAEITDALENVNFVDMPETPNKSAGPASGRIRIALVIALAALGISAPKPAQAQAPAVTAPPTPAEISGLPGADTEYKVKFHASYDAIIAALNSLKKGDGKKYKGKPWYQKMIDGLAEIMLAERAQSKEDLTAEMDRLIESLKESDQSGEILKLLKELQNQTLTVALGEESIQKVGEATGKAAGEAAGNAVAEKLAELEERDKRIPYMTVSLDTNIGIGRPDGTPLIIGGKLGVETQVATGIGASVELGGAWTRGFEPNGPEVDEGVLTTSVGGFYLITEGENGGHALSLGVNLEAVLHDLDGVEAGVFLLPGVEIQYCPHHRFCVQTGFSFPAMMGNKELEHWAPAGIDAGLAARLF